MPAPTEYRFLSAAMPRPSAKVQYVSADDAASMRRRSAGILDQYPYLRELSLDWLDRYDERALDAVELFLTSAARDIDAERAGHDIAVYRCNWVVVNSATAYWVLDPAGTCFVQLGDQLLDPYRFVVQCVTDRQPGARRFVEQARKLGA